MESGWVQAGLMLVGMLLSGGAVYAGVRADLARIHERLSHVGESSTRAHARIDEILRGCGHDRHG